MGTGVIPGLPKIGCDVIGIFLEMTGEPDERE